MKKPILLCKKFCSAYFVCQWKKPLITLTLMLYLSLILFILRYCCFSKVFETVRVIYILCHSYIKKLEVLVPIDKFYLLRVSKSYMECLLALNFACPSSKRLLNVFGTLLKMKTFLIFFWVILQICRGDLNFLVTNLYYYKETSTCLNILHWAE